MSSSPLSVSVVIATRNRRDELRRALVSAEALATKPEILVLDDASEDGTPEMVAAEFPAIRLYCDTTRRGYVVRRNEAAVHASGDVLVSIDDDADFSDPDCLRDLQDVFAERRVGAAGLPYVNVVSGRAGSAYQQAPDDRGVWLSSSFVGTAYAVRRDVFLAMGGFREELIHQGEERDFCMRLLERGLVVGLCASPLVRHYPSPNRDIRRMDIYGRRNEILWAYTYLPALLALSFIAAYSIRGVYYGIRVGRLGAMLEGLRQGYRACWALRSDRTPMPAAVLALERRLRRSGPLRLAEVERHLAAFSA